MVRPRRGPVGLAIGILLAIPIGGCGIVEQNLPPTLDVSLELDLTLSVDEPIVTRAIRFEAVPGPERLQWIEFSAFSDVEDGVGSRLDVWVSFVDPETGGLAGSVPWAHASLGAPSTAGVCPIEGCDETWVVIVRWLDPVPAETVTGTIHARMSARAMDLTDAGEPPFSLETLAVTEVHVPDPTPSSAASARVRGEVRIDAGQPDVRSAYVVRVDPAVLGLERAYPSVGRLAFFADGTDTSDRTAALASRITLPPGVAERGAGLANGDTTPTALEIDLLSSCPATGACEIPIEIVWSLAAVSERESLPPDAWAAAAWHLEARFEAESGTSLPADAITIVPSPAS